MSEFYSIDSTRVSHAEFWWGTRSPLVLLGWLTKWFRIRLPSSTDDPNVDSTLPFVVESLPVDEQAFFEPLRFELAALGFDNPVYQVIRDPATGTAIFWATFLHSSGRHFARIHHRTWSRSRVVSRALFPMFFTGFADGTFLVSSAGKPDMQAPPTVEMIRMRGAKPEALWAAHQQRAENLSQRKNIAPVRTPDELLASAERLHVLLRDFHLARGVFRRRTAEEQAAAAALTARMAAAPGGELQYADVLMELDRLQRKKAGLKATFWILGLSLLAFMVVGAASWNWRFTALLLPILFFHEAGHWVAMRVCRYRNLRMFFIPLFGAAVTGQNWNVPGWKKAIVALAGPVPGIIAGIAFGILGAVLRKDWLTEAALIALLVNGFNLLPILPLDGGRVLHATLFCRNRWLDILFRCAAVLSLVLLGILGHIRVFTYLAILLAIGLPVLFKIGKVTDQLRQQGLPPPVPGQDEIPTTTAQAIIGAVKEALPKQTSARVVAQHSLNVFETLNARPPGALATLGLLGIHGGTVFIALIAAMLLIVQRHGGLADLFSAATRQPAHSATCDAIAAATGPGPANRPGQRQIVVATFSDAAKARSAFDALTPRLPESGKLVLFGDSLLLKLSATVDEQREQWFNEMSALTTNAFVATSNRAVMVSLTCLAPTETAATNLEAEFNLYFATGVSFPLAPPWSPEAGDPGFNKFLQARRQWVRIGSSLNEIWTDPAMQSLSRKVTAANRRGADAEMKRLSVEQEQLAKNLRSMRLNQLRAPGPDGVDPVLVDLYEQLEETPYTNRVARETLSRRITDQLGAAGPVDCGTQSGLVSRHGLLLETRWMSFRDVSTGLPALARWLCARGCIRIQYEISGAVPAWTESDMPEDE